MLLCSCALEHYFESIEENIDYDLVALMPLQMRAQDGATAGNLVTARFVDLRNTIADFDKRLHAIIDDTRAIKERVRSQEKDSNSKKFPLEPGDVTELFDPIMLDIATYVIKRTNLLNKLMLSNTVIANVPGSPEPVYLAGARQVGSVPMAPVIPFLGLTIGVTSNESKVFIGFHGCDIDDNDKEYFVDGAATAFAKLTAITQRATQTKKAGPKRPRPTKARTKRCASTSRVRKTEAEPGTSTTKKAAPKKTRQRKKTASQSTSAAKKKRGASDSANTTATAS